MSDEEIAVAHNLISVHPTLNERVAWRRDVLSALATARAEQRAEDVRLLRDYYCADGGPVYEGASYWLEQCKLS